MRYLVLVALFSFQALASVDAGSWNKLMADVGAKGTQTVMNDGTEFRSFAQLSPNNASVSHIADYYSAHGNADATGKFVPTDVDEVSEIWTLANNQWSIVQYIFEMDLKGNVTKIDYSAFTEGMDGSVSVQAANEINPADPTSLAMLQTKLASWYAFDQTVK